MSLIYDRLLGLSTNSKEMNQIVKEAMSDEFKIESFSDIFKSASYEALCEILGVSTNKEKLNDVYNKKVRQI